MLDVSVRAGILNTTRRLARELGLATVYISHDLSLLQYTCDRIAIMYLGEIVEIGPTNEVIHNPQHPYTQALIAAVPAPDPTLENPPLRIREGVPRPTELFVGCPFAQRCPDVMEACLSVRPPASHEQKGPHGAVSLVWRTPRFAQAQAGRRARVRLILRRSRVANLMTSGEPTISSDALNLIFIVLLNGPIGNLLLLAALAPTVDCKPGGWQLACWRRS